MKTGAGCPELPLKFSGYFYTKGWDIPTLVAIDSSNQCWINDSDGGALEKCTVEDLLLETDERDEETRNFIKGYLGIPQSTRCTCCNGTGWIKG